jgi:hypothetical protein
MKVSLPRIFAHDIGIRNLISTANFEDPAFHRR